MIGTDPLTADHVRRFFALLEARDWTALRPLVADDLVYEVPQTRERVRGGDAWIRFCAEFAGDWHLAVDRVVVDAAAGEAAVEILAALGGVPLDNVAWLTFDEAGRVRRFVDRWPEAYEPPAGRPDVVERY